MEQIIKENVNPIKEIVLFEILRIFEKFQELSSRKFGIYIVRNR